MNGIFRIWIVILGVMIFSMAGAGESRPVSDLSGEDFLQTAANRMPNTETAARLIGRIQTMKRNAGRAEELAVELLIVQDPLQMGADLILERGREEVLMVRKMFTQQHFLERKPNAGLLELIGLEPSDLVLGFLDGKLLREEARETVRTVPCRVLLLELETKQLAKVWISADYFFPLRAEFYAAKPEDKLTPENRLRTLEITGFKKIGKYYTVTEFSILGKDFRTRAIFQELQMLEAQASQVKQWKERIMFLEQQEFKKNAGKR